MNNPENNSRIPSLDELIARDGAVTPVNQGIPDPVEALDIPIQNAEQEDNDTFIIPESLLPLFIAAHASGIPEETIAAVLSGNTLLEDLPTETLIQLVSALPTNTQLPLEIIALLATALSEEPETMDTITNETTTDVNGLPLEPSIHTPGLLFTLFDLSPNIIE